MKTLFRTLFLFALMAALTFSARAGLILGGYTLTTITTAGTNTSTFLTNVVYIPLPQITVTNTAISSTNSYTGFFRWSVDNVNFFTNASPAFYPSTTNAAATAVAQQYVAVPIYVQMVAYTNAANTTTINIGVTSP